MSTLKLTSLIIMVSFYLFAGVSHFRKPNFFLKITPKWVPFPEIINLIVGAFEIILGLLLIFRVTRSFAAWGIIVLLVLVFPANVYHFQKAMHSKKAVALTAMRLPLQLALMYWAYIFVS